MESPSRVLEAVDTLVEETETSFLGAMANETARLQRQDETFRGRARQSKEVLLDERTDMRRLMTSGEGRVESPWFIGAVLICPLAAQACAIAAGVVVTAAVTYVVVKQTK